MKLHTLVKTASAASALAAGLLAMPGALQAASLADQPVFAAARVPGNVALALSVEYPTATRAAYTDAYSSGATFLGYFDPAKCYAYVANPVRNDTHTGDTGYFRPAAVATAHRCNGMWSGNFLNWSATATIDPFRWAMTGGRRVVDTPTETVLEKGWQANRAGFDDRALPQGEIAGATPYPSAGRLVTSVAGRGFSMHVSASRTFKGEYFNNMGFSGAPAVTDPQDTGYHNWGLGSPAAGINADQFAARLKGSFTAPETGAYTFRVVGDDGIRLWINGVPVIDRWHDQSASTYSATVSLVKDAPLDIRMEFYENGGYAVMQLDWKPPSATRFTPVTDGTVETDLTMRTKVCDPGAPGGVEANCRKYGANWKPEGLIQKYAQQMRFSAFGYLNDSNNQRDGGVLRAQQKYVGPMRPVPGSPAAANGETEWSETTGVFLRNPNPADATDTTRNTGVSVDDSGVVNYLNKFGQIIPGDYKSFDPVSELYYAALRYYKNLGNIPSWSDMSGGSAATRRIWADGFPVITNWRDPIEHSCQRNFILGIGDIYTHTDKNVPGNTGYRADEPPAPDFTTDTTNAVRSTNRVGALQALGDIGNTNSFSGRSNSAYIAGMAFDANTADIRPDIATQANTLGKQTVQTFWIDVLERPFEANNQFYLAAKYGGLKLPDAYDPYTFTGTIEKEWWSTTTDMVGGQPRPDNYFTVGRADKMIDGLTQAFANIASAIKIYTSSTAVANQRITPNGTDSYASQYDPSGWTSTLSQTRLTFDKSGIASSTVSWTTAGPFETQLKGLGWNTARNIVTWNGSAGVPFRRGDLTAAQLSQLDSPWASGDDSANYLNYLRGDRTQERTSPTDETHPYRHRNALLGDIVGSDVRVVTAPSSRFSDATNAGYLAFKTAKAMRPTMVYVGANDGMLHAFRSGAPASGGGTEQFAYVPAALFAGPTTPGATPALNGLAQLGNPDYEHRFYVDATPLDYDIDFNNAGGPGASTSAGASDWHTVLIGGLGKGGRSFYALDVTDPGSMTSEAAVKTKVLWEFTDPTMGFSYGAPVVVKTPKYGWVVVLASGYNNADGYGYLYFLDPHNGKLLEKVRTPSASAGLAQMTAHIKDFRDGTTDAIYAGDLDGQMWRFDVTAKRGSASPYPTPLKLAVATDAAGKPQPITTQPLVEIDPRSRKRFVMFGTGQLLDSADIISAAPQSFYAVVDGNANRFGTAADLPPGMSFPIVRDNLLPWAIPDLVGKAPIDLANKAGWRMDLGVVGATGTGAPANAWRLVVRPTAASGGILAFTTLLTKGNACSPSGTSNVFALNFGTGKSAFLNTPSGYVSLDSAATRVQLVGDGKGGQRLIVDTVDGKVPPIPPLDPKAATGDTLRLLNWREIPAVD